MEALNIIGGGAKSIQQAGMLKRYAELGRKPDMIFGCSGGALSAFLYAQGEIDLLEWIWLNISNKEVRKLDLKGILTLNNIYDFSPLQKLVAKHLKLDKIIGGTPLYISVTSLIDNCAVRYPIHQDHMTPLKIQKYNGFLHYSRPSFEMTDRADIILASASIPVLVKPVNGYFYDGGVTDNYNLTGAMAYGATNIVMMHPGKPAEKEAYPNIIEAAGVLCSLPEWSIYLKEKEVFNLCNQQENSDLRRRYSISAFNHANCSLTEVFGDATGISLFDFEYKGLDRKALIQRGYDAAKAALG